MRDVGVGERKIVRSVNRDYCRSPKLIKSHSQVAKGTVGHFWRTI